MNRAMEQIDINRIVDPTIPMRTDLDDLELVELANSIKHVGLIEPLVVKIVGDSYEVVAGHRRLLACRKVNYTPIPCVVVADQDSDPEVIKLHENSYRTDVNVVDEAYFISSVMQKTNKGPADIAQLLGRSHDYVRGRLDIINMPEDVVVALYNKKITLGVARKLAQIDDLSSLRMYLGFAIKEGVTVPTADSWLRQYKAGLGARSEEEIEVVATPSGENKEVIRVRCKICGEMKPVEETVLVYVDRVCNAALEQNLRQMGIEDYL